ncbi:hypothetical protein LCGC14_2449630 [marine sediment metagenome]|uniref:Mutator family transposase n=1 Tax=marine sediment metagenome TaxID=412755 RepID=A0A0F9C446_9ZZZZ
MVDCPSSGSRTQVGSVTTGHWESRRFRGGPCRARATRNQLIQIRGLVKDLIVSFDFVDYRQGSKRVQPMHEHPPFLPDRDLSGTNGKQVGFSFLTGQLSDQSHVTDQMRDKLPRLSGLMDDSEEDVLAYMTFPHQHRTKLHSTNPIERLNGEIKRRTDVGGIFPNEAAIRRLVGAILMEQTEKWTVQRAPHMTLETLAPVCDDPIISLPATQTD